MPNQGAFPTNVYLSKREFEELVADLDDDNPNTLTLTPKSHLTFNEPFLALKQARLQLKLRSGNEAYLWFLELHAGSHIFLEDKPFGVIGLSAEDDIVYTTPIFCRPFNQTQYFSQRQNDHILIYFRQAPGDNTNTQMSLHEFKETFFADPAASSFREIQISYNSSQWDEPQRGPSEGGEEEEGKDEEKEGDDKSKEAPNGGGSSSEESKDEGGKKGIKPMFLGPCGPPIMPAFRPQKSPENPNSYPAQVPVPVLAAPPLPPQTFAPPPPPLPPPPPPYNPFYSPPPAPPGRCPCSGYYPPMPAPIPICPQPYPYAPPPPPSAAGPTPLPVGAGYGAPPPEPYPVCPPPVTNNMCCCPGGYPPPAYDVPPPPPPQLLPPPASLPANPPPFIPIPQQPLALLAPGELAPVSSNYLYSNVVLKGVGPPTPAAKMRKHKIVFLTPPSHNPQNNQIGSHPGNMIENPSETNPVNQGDERITQPTLEKASLN
ncbi:hypothetical protein Ddc_07093 [Ditylenchus destructor]|nr:hypothetical protein Ddc_07093 [Ditylenchus destructor]